MGRDTASSSEGSEDTSATEDGQPSFDDRLLASVSLLEQTEGGRRAIVFWGLQLGRGAAELVELQYAGEPRRILWLVEHWLTSYLTTTELFVHAHDGIRAVGTTQAATSAASLVKQLALLAYAAAGRIREGGRWGSGADLERLSLSSLVAGIARDACRAGLTVPEIPLPSSPP